MISLFRVGLLIMLVEAGDHDASASTSVKQGFAPFKALEEKFVNYHCEIYSASDQHIAEEDDKLVQAAQVVHNQSFSVGYESPDGRDKKELFAQTSTNLLRLTLVYNQAEGYTLTVPLTLKKEEGEKNYTFKVTEDDFSTFTLKNDLQWNDVQKDHNGIRFSFENLSTGTNVGSHWSKLSERQFKFLEKDKLEVSIERSQVGEDHVILKVQEMKYIENILLTETTQAKEKVSEDHGLQCYLRVNKQWVDFSKGDYFNNDECDQYPQRIVWTSEQSSKLPDLVWLIDNGHTDDSSVWSSVSVLSSTSSNQNAQYRPSGSGHQKNSCADNMQTIDEAPSECKHAGGSISSESKLDSAVEKIQSVARRHLATKEFNKKIILKKYQALGKIQNSARRYMATNKVNKMKREKAAAETIQKNQRRYIAKKADASIDNLKAETEVDVDMGCPISFGEGVNELYAATRAGDAAVVEKLLKDETLDVNKGHGFAADSLVERYLQTTGGDTDMKKTETLQNRLGHSEDRPPPESSLMLAVERGEMSVIKKFLESKNIDINKDNFFGQTALHLAVEKGNFFAVQALLEHPEIDVNRMDGCNYNMTKDDEAKQKELVKMLKNNPSSIEGWLTPLIDATRRNFKDIVELLLAHPKIDVNFESPIYGKALHIALEKNHSEIAEMIINHILERQTQPTSSGNELDSNQDEVADKTNSVPVELEPLQQLEKSTPPRNVEQREQDLQQTEEDFEKKQQEFSKQQEQDLKNKQAAETVQKNVRRYMATRKVNNVKQEKAAETVQNKTPVVKKQEDVNSNTEPPQKTSPGSDGGNGGGDDSSFEGCQSGDGDGGKVPGQELDSQNKREDLQKPPQAPFDRREQDLKQKENDFKKLEQDLQQRENDLKQSDQDQQSFKSPKDQDQISATTDLESQSGFSLDSRDKNQQDAKQNNSNENLNTNQQKQVQVNEPGHHQTDDTEPQKDSTGLFDSALEENVVGDQSSNLSATEENDSTPQVPITPPASNSDDQTYGVLENMQEDTFSKLLQALRNDKSYPLTLGGLDADELSETPAKPSTGLLYWAEAEYIGLKEDGTAIVKRVDGDDKELHASTVEGGNIFIDEGYLQRQEDIANFANGEGSAFVQLRSPVNNFPTSKIESFQMTYLVKQRMGRCRCAPAYEGDMCEFIKTPIITADNSDSTWWIWLLVIGLFVFFSLIGVFVTFLIFLRAKNKTSPVQNLAAIVLAMKESQEQYEKQKQERYEKFLDDQNVALTEDGRSKTFLPPLKDPFKVPTFRVHTPADSEADPDESTGNPNSPTGALIRPLQTQSTFQSDVIENATLVTNLLFSSFGLNGAKAIYEDLESTVPTSNPPPKSNKRKNVLPSLGKVKAYYNYDNEILAIGWNDSDTLVANFRNGYKCGIIYDKVLKMHVMKMKYKFKDGEREVLWKSTAPLEDLKTDEPPPREILWIGDDLATDDLFVHCVTWTLRQRSELDDAYEGPEEGGEFENRLVQKLSSSQES